MEKFLKNKIKNSEKGQVLMEAIIGLAIAVIMIIGAVVTISGVLRSTSQSKNFQAASFLAQELLEEARIIAESDWRELYDLFKGSGNKYHVAISSGSLEFLAGSENKELNDVAYTRYLYVENVSRLGGAIVESGGTDDSSTQKIVSRTEWQEGGQTLEVELVSYVTRWRNSVLRQTDWSGGAVSRSSSIPAPDDKFESSDKVNFSSLPGSLCVENYPCN